MPTVDGSALGRDLRVAIIVSRYHEFVTDRLRAGALEALSALGVAARGVSTVTVPGAFEIPQAARALAATGRVDAVVCLACLIRGETPHFDYIASSVAHGITHVATTMAIPMTFGVLTTNSAEEALARAGAGSTNKGWEAATAAVELAVALRSIGGSAGAEVGT